MPEHFNEVIFEKLEIRNIRELRTGWKTSLKEMTEIARKLMGPDANLPKIAKGLYGNSSPHSVKRIERFRDVALSISHHGYCTLLDHSLEELQEMYHCSYQTTLPRIYNTGRIDDGRHRLAALLANGYEEAVVAVCSPKSVSLAKGDVKKERIDKSHAILYQSIADAAKEFGKSERYITWKMTSKGSTKNG